jgi:hypothetical protein
MDMKSSELRAQLQSLEEEHGDLEVKVDDRDMGYYYDIERVAHEPNISRNGKPGREHWFEISS